MSTTESTDLISFVSAMKACWNISLIEFAASFLEVKIALSLYSTMGPSDGCFWDLCTLHVLPTELKTFHVRYFIPEDMIEVIVLKDREATWKHFSGCHKLTCGNIGVGPRHFISVVEVERIIISHTIIGPHLQPVPCSNRHTWLLLSLYHQRNMCFHEVYRTTNGKDMNHREA